VINQNPLKEPRGSIFVYIKGFAAFLIFLGTLLGAFFGKMSDFLNDFN
jgi:hypothetical protein